MWRTPKGNRTLSGVESEVFLEGLRSLAAELRDQRGAHESDVPAFDGLSFGQRVSTIQDVADGLLRSDVSKRSAVCAAAPPRPAPHCTAVPPARSRSDLTASACSSLDSRTP